MSIYKQSANLVHTMASFPSVEYSTSHGFGDIMVKFTVVGSDHLKSLEK